MLSGFHGRTHDSGKSVTAGANTASLPRAYLAVTQCLAKLRRPRHFCLALPRSATRGMGLRGFGGDAVQTGQVNQ
jgi:hypothetical protein